VLNGAPLGPPAAGRLALTDLPASLSPSVMIAAHEVAHL